MARLLGLAPTMARSVGFAAPGTVPLLAFRSNRPRRPANPGARLIAEAAYRDAREIRGPRIILEATWTMQASASSLVNKAYSVQRGLEIAQTPGTGSMRKGHRTT